MSDKGFLYCATSEKSLVQALKSAEWLRGMSDFPVSIAVGKDQSARAKNSGIFDVVISVQDVFNRTGDKIQAIIASPYARTCFLDSDTLVGRSVDFVFDLLDKYDLLACHHVPTRAQAEEGGQIPLSFPQINSGVLFWERNDRTNQFLVDWLRTYREDPLKKRDQHAFRRCLFENKSGIRMYILPPEFNFRCNFMPVAYGPVYIFHSHSLLTLSLEEAKSMMIIFNRSPKPRIWKQTLSFETLVRYVDGMG
jgi:hypothetical protein